MNQSKPHLKVILLGDSGVGKTSLLSMYTSGTRVKSHVPTIGTDFKVKELFLNDKLVWMQIWDTAGQERFRCLTTSYFRNVDCLVLVFDVTSISSFDNLTTWVDEFCLYHVSRNRDGHNFENESSSVPIVILGNKADVADFDRQVSNRRVENWIETYLKGRATYHEVSACEDWNVSLAFLDIAEKAEEYYSQHEPSNLLDPSRRDLLSIQDKTDKKKRRCC
jgi:Ras-related protein Rab-7A